MFEALRKFFDSSITFQQVSLELSYGQFFLRILLPIGLIVATAGIFTKLLKHYMQKIPWKAHSINVCIRWGTRIIRLTAFILLIVVFSQFLDEEITRYFRLFTGMLTQPIFSSGQSQISILTLLLIIPLFYVANIFAKSLQSFTERKVLPFLTKSDVVRFSTANLLRYVFMVFFLIMGLALIGINLSSVMIVFGLLGIGIGLGLQGTVENLFAGIVIIVSRPIKVGDRIQLHEHLGDVITIKLLHTIINTVTNETLIVPNKELVSQVVHNYTHELDPRVVLTTNIQVSYQSDLEQVRDLLLNILRRVPHGLQEAAHPPAVYLISFDESGITFRLVCWIDTVHNKFHSLSWLNFEIWRTFAQENINIPFPQLDVHITHDSEDRKKT